MSAWRLAALLPALRRGRHGLAPEVDVVHGEAIEIETDAAMSINTDGEVLSAIHAHYSILPRAATFFAGDAPFAAAPAS